MESGDFVYSRLFAWQGSFEIAGEPEVGCVVSGEFPTYVADKSTIDVRWLRYWLLSAIGLRAVLGRSMGTTSASRNRLREDRFETLEIPLPSIDEQLRAADRLDVVEATSAELRQRSGHASVLSDALAVSIASCPDLSDAAKQGCGWRRVRLGSAMQPANERVMVEASRSYPNVGVYSFGRGLFEKPDIDGASTSATALNRIKAGQFIYSRLFAFEGAYTYVPPEFDSYYVSNEFPTLDTDPEQLDARWLATFVRSAERWAELGGRSKGLGVRRQRVPVEALMDYEVWLPPITTQHAMVTAIEDVRKTSAARRTAHERIDALLPAAINEAFASLS